jgi:ureidoglycolate dehydrogenase (NAD+)
VALVCRVPVYLHQEEIHMKLVKAEDLLKLVTEIFEKRGVTRQDSGITANALVHAEIRGVNSHGVMRVAHYVKRLEIGSINPKPQEQVERTGPATAFLEGEMAWAMSMGGMPWSSPLRWPGQTGLAW